jgi:purine-binding chemotaxis protein CheW
MSDQAVLTRSPAGELQFVSFVVGELLLGIDIRRVREINRNWNLTVVPHAAQAVCGVINLRGDVVTIVDLRTVLGLPASAPSRERRNIIVHADGEQIGLLADRVSDVIVVEAEQIHPLPENLAGADGEFFQGVFKLDHGLLAILDVERTLSLAGHDVDAKPSATRASSRSH